jgi:hypothetical protein
MSRTVLKEAPTLAKVDQRSAGRHKLILRVGLLEQDGRSIFCLVKNISATGVQVKPYGDVSKGTGVSLRVGDENIPGTPVWSRDGLVGVKFRQTLNPQALLRIGQNMVVHRRRTAPRVLTDLKGVLRTGGIRRSVTICDLSMAGARVRIDQPVTFGNSTILEVPGLPSLTACVRWSDGAGFGVSFQTPLSIQMVADLLSKVEVPKPLQRVRAAGGRELRTAEVDEIATLGVPPGICPSENFGRRPRDR